MRYFVQTASQQLPSRTGATTQITSAAAELRVAAYDWNAMGVELDTFGCAVLPGLLSPAECAEIAALYPHEENFRSHVHMARHGFGKGEYRYFKYPLPKLIDGLRTALYARAVTFANAWSERMKITTRYPNRHTDYLKLCHKAGQTRPTPLLLQYVARDFNCLHQDLYGELSFPLQVTALLSAPDKDFSRSRAAAARRCRALRRA
jgi:uncharacterized protein